jgi:hypothetical protein
MQACFFCMLVPLMLLQCLVYMWLQKGVFTCMRCGLAAISIFNPCGPLIVAQGMAFCQHTSRVVYLWLLRDVCASRYLMPRFSSTPLYYIYSFKLQRPMFGPS